MPIADQKQNGDLPSDYFNRFESKDIDIVIDDCYFWFIDEENAVLCEVVQHGHAIWGLATKFLDSWMITYYRHNKSRNVMSRDFNKLMTLDSMDKLDLYLFDVFAEGLL